MIASPYRYAVATVWSQYAHGCQHPDLKLNDAMEQHALHTQDDVTQVCFPTPRRQLPWPDMECFELGHGLGHCRTL